MTDYCVQPILNYYLGIPARNSFIERMGYALK